MKFRAKPSRPNSKKLSVTVHAAGCSCVADGLSGYDLEASTVSEAIREVEASERDDALPDPTRGVKIKAAPCCVAPPLPTPEECENIIRTLGEALIKAERGLKGEYPWVLARNEKYSQKEAREAALGHIKIPLEMFYEFRDKFRSVG
jgi:hypothetical protein